MIKLRIEKIKVDVPVIAYQTWSIYAIHEENDEENILDGELQRRFPYDSEHKHIM